MVAGSLDVWAKQFPEDQLASVIRLILESWTTFKVPEDRREVPITQRFCCQLRSARDRSIHFFRIDSEFSVLDETAQLKGRIDLTFSSGFDEAVYFSLECKRLRVRQPSGFTSLAGEYVTEGVVRYVSGQYAGGQNVGGMLGYVMDGQIDSAISDVRTAIEERRGDLVMSPDETLRCSSCVDSEQVKESWHNVGPQRFVVHHVFVGCAGAN